MQVDDRLRNPAQCSTFSASVNAAGHEAEKILIASVAPAQWCFLSSEAHQQIAVEHRVRR